MSLISPHLPDNVRQHLAGGGRIDVNRFQVQRDIVEKLKAENVVRPVGDRQDPPEKETFRFQQINQPGNAGESEGKVEVDTAEFPSAELIEMEANAVDGLRSRLKEAEKGVAGRGLH